MDRVPQRDQHVGSQRQADQELSADEISAAFVRTLGDPLAVAY